MLANSYNPFRSKPALPATALERELAQAATRSNGFDVAANLASTRCATALLEEFYDQGANDGVMV